MDFLCPREEIEEFQYPPEEEDDGPTVQRISDRDGVNLKKGGGGRRYLCPC
jgi:hypothetical protein